jgi:hypothetical protein
VFVRFCRRAGFTSTEIAGALLGQERRHDSKALRRWEKTAQRLERAEGTSAPAISDDPAAFQAVAYANTALRRYLKRGKFDRRVAAAEMQARSEGHKEKAFETRTHQLLGCDPAFLDAAAEAKSLAADKDQALTFATGHAPLFPTGDPEINRGEAAAYRAQAKRLRLEAKAKLSPSTVRELPSDPKLRDEVLRLASEQQGEDHHIIHSPDRWAIPLTKRDHATTVV